MISALEGNLFIGHKNIVNICKILQCIFLKTIFEYYNIIIGSFIQIFAKL